MVPHRFQLLISTLAIVELEGHYSVAYVPIGDTVNLIDGPLNGTQLVDVQWNGKPARMFASDLRERAAQIQEAFS